MNEITEQHVALGRALIRERQRSLGELLASWGLDHDAYWAALSGQGRKFRKVEAAPLLPSEVLAADPRNRGGLAEIQPIVSGDRKLCGVPGCGRPHRALGYCMAHHRRLARDGDAQVDTPLAVPRQESKKACKTPGCAGKVMVRRNAAALPEADDYCGRCYRNLRDRRRRGAARKEEVIFA